MATDRDNIDPALLPQEGITYPIEVEYCPFEPFVPYEYCEYYRDYEGCRKWLESNMPDRFGALSVEGGDADDDAKKRQKRGGKGSTKPKKKEAEVEKRILLSIAPRGKKKAVTVVQGLKTCGIDLKVASKFFGQKFACGASITGDDEIVIQGDFKDDLFDLIPEKWKDVDEDLIEDLGSKKR